MMMMAQRYGRLSAGIAALANASARSGMAMLHPIDLTAIDALRQLQHPFDAGLRRTTGRIALVANQRQLEAAPEILNEIRAIEIRSGGGEHARHQPAAGHVEAVRYAGETGFDQQRRLQPVSGRHAREHERLLDVIDVEQPLPRSRGLLRAVAEEIAECAVLPGA